MGIGIVLEDTRQHDATQQLRVANPPEGMLEATRAAKAEDASYCFALK